MKEQISRFLDPANKQEYLKRLELARYRINTEWTRYVCVALSNPYSNWSADGIEHQLVNWITNSIGGGLYGTVSGWLRDHAGISNEDMTDDNLRAYRLRWIAEMIKQVETM